MGKVEETLGHVTGFEGLKTSGQERRAQGDGEYKDAQSQGYVEGTKDRVLGKKDQLSGAVTGDNSQEAAGMFHHLATLVAQVADTCPIQAVPAISRARLSKTGTSRKLSPLVPLNETSEMYLSSVQM
jgi:uncharacterized protein YjbJ (UPF0337 family)